MYGYTYLETHKQQSLMKVDAEPNLPIVRWLLSIMSTKQWILMKISRIDAMKREMEGKAAWGHRRL
ncbi:hypothetical protein SLEP1_g40362 [Rubroshorea leprosula]|uniref:Uncharacterized protein n=1 Tax=Rubroshorea leprosula TaxID=152421 RepID=A0AAV5L409_9ROSI|nr:hypothetical protein SLEP1_g40362 [Rubroshorea leprosula]